MPSPQLGELETQAPVSAGGGRGAQHRRGDARRLVVRAGSVVRVAPPTPRSHRNEGDEPVELWAVSRRIDHSDSTKIDDFWEASPDAVQQRPVD